MKQPRCRAQHRLRTGRPARTLYRIALEDFGPSGPPMSGPRPAEGADGPGNADVGA